MTLIVLLILAGVSLSAVFSEKGIFSRAEQAGNKYNEAKAREVLETVLLADGQYEKHTNPKYNQDDFLDELIKSQIEGSDVKGDVAIIGGEYAYELDRSVPKIGRYLGNPKDLVWPTIDATVKLANDKKNATITITASENKNGINKIEIWLLGEKIKEYEYNTTQTEVTVEPPYTATQNGKYTIKAYGDLMASKTVEVDGIVASVKFEPNGNEEWKKEHSTTVTIQETADKIVNAKYVWTNSVTTPEDNQFLEEQTFKSGDTITGGNNTMTGTYYLWTMLTTKSGAKVKWRSEGFNFDNEGPTITKFTAEKYSETGITLSVTSQDNKSGIIKIEYYVDNVIQDSYTEAMDETTSSITRTVNITGLSTGSHTCKVIVYDAKNNSSTKTVSGTTKLYYWNRYANKNVPTYVDEVTGTNVIRVQSVIPSAQYVNLCASSYDTDKSTGEYVIKTTSEIDVYRNASSAIGRYYLDNVSYDATIEYRSRTLYRVTGINSKSVLESNGRYYSKVYYDVEVRTMKSKPTPTKGDFIEEVPSTSATTYIVGELNSDGYWYDSPTIK